MKGPINYRGEWYKGCVYGPDGSIQRQVLMTEGDGLDLCIFHAPSEVVDMIFSWREQCKKLEAAARDLLGTMVMEANEPGEYGDALPDAIHALQEALKGEEMQ